MKKQTKSLMGVNSVSAWRARKCTKHTTMAPVSRALMNKERAYGPRKLQPSSSMPGSSSLNRVQSAAHSKAIARERVFRNWAMEWQASRRKRVGQDSFAYEYAIPNPPDGKNHPLWRAATMTTTHPTSGHRVPLFSRHTTSTAFRLAVGHSFTSEYTRRFRPDLDSDDLACPCGFPDHSFYHILYDCRLHSRVRVEVNPNLRWASESPDFYLSTVHGGFMFCDFLQRSHAAFKPPNETRVPWDPG